MNCEEILNKAYVNFKKVLSEKLKGKTFTPKTALILGSGLGALGDEIETVASIFYSEIDGFPVSTAPGHKGRFVFGKISGVDVVLMQGRVHFYEGYSAQETVLPVRLMRLIGAENILITNASGSLDPEFKAGDFMIITDHITNFVPSPLIGNNIESLGVRFPDMREIYRKDLSDKIKIAAENIKVSEGIDITLREGIYVQLTGPNYETPAEVRMCRLLGGSAVGMSTGIEAVAANHCGLKVAGISCIANLGCGIGDKPLTCEEVIETGEKVAPVFKKLVKEIIKLWG